MSGWNFDDDPVFKLSRYEMRILSIIFGCVLVVAGAVLAAVVIG